MIVLKFIIQNVLVISIVLLIAFSLVTRAVQAKSRRSI